MDANHQDTTNNHLTTTEDVEWVRSKKSKLLIPQHKNRSKGWTGFSGKTLWDWLQLLIVPIVLAGGGYLFGTWQHNVDQQHALDQQQATILQTYTDNIQDLLLHNNLGKSKPTDDVAILARARTLTALQGLDPERKSLLLQFLYEAHLIGYIHYKDGKPITFKIAGLITYVTDSIINLENANLSGTNLPLSYLDGANLYGVTMIGANLSKTSLTGADMLAINMTGADLNGTFLQTADMRSAKLNNANLTDGYLEGAYLMDADLSGANLTRADLTGTNLGIATITPEQLANAYSLKDTILPDGSIFPSKTWPIPGRDGECVYKVSNGRCYKEGPAGAGI